MKSKTYLRTVAIYILAIILGLSSTSSSAQKQEETLSGTTERVSVSSAGEQGN